jgi:hypothetical protein
MEAISVGITDDSRSSEPPPDVRVGIIDGHLEFGTSANSVSASSFLPWVDRRLRGRHRGRFCHGQAPLTSTCREKLRKVLISTIPPSTATLWAFGVTATVRMMSAATSNSRPRSIERPSCCRNSR